MVVRGRGAMMIKSILYAEVQLFMLDFRPDNLSS